MGLFIGIMLGACVMPIILQIYQRIFLRGDDSDAARALQRVITCFWIAFVSTNEISVMIMYM